MTVLFGAGAPGPWHDMLDGVTARAGHLVRGISWQRCGDLKSWDHLG